MSQLFPEQPLLFYPSLAKRFGVEEALLLGIYHQFAQHHGHLDDNHNHYFLARRGEWQQLAEFWDDEKLAQVTGSLVSQGAISAEFHSNGSIRIDVLNNPLPVPQTTKVAEAPIPAYQPLDVAEEKPFTPTEPVAADPLAMEENSMLSRGPAPSFGGSTGWNRRQDDELETLFKEQEKRNQLLQEIDLNWRPTTTTMQLLAKHSIPEGFIADQLDEFITYWLAQGHKKKTWDPPFIDHVKRKWVREQNRQGREAKQSEQLATEGQGERYQSSSRAEKREKISGVVMDIKNLDWI